MEIDDLEIVERDGCPTVSLPRTEGAIIRYAYYSERTGWMRMARLNWTSVYPVYVKEGDQWLPSPIIRNRYETFEQGTLEYAAFEMLQEYVENQKELSV